MGVRGTRYEERGTRPRCTLLCIYYAAMCLSDFERSFQVMARGALSHCPVPQETGSGPEPETAKKAVRLKQNHNRQLSLCHNTITIHVQYQHQET